MGYSKLQCKAQEPYLQPWTKFIIVLVPLKVGLYDRISVASKSSVYNRHLQWKETRISLDLSWVPQQQCFIFIC